MVEEGVAYGNTGIFVKKGPLPAFSFSVSPWNSKTKMQNPFEGMVIKLMNLSKYTTAAPSWIRWEEQLGGGGDRGLVCGSSGISTKFGLLFTLCEDLHM